MTSKEALEYIATEKGIDNITGAIEYNYKLYQVCIKIILDDLDKLEDLKYEHEDLKENYELLKDKYNNLKEH